MPIYEYACMGCSHSFELIQRMSDEPVSLCPECQEDKATRLVSAPKFKLKGTGWYETDFKDKPKHSGDKTKPAKAESTVKSSKETVSTKKED